MIDAAISDAMKETDPYLLEFERFDKPAAHPSWLYPIRKAGIARFAELGFPTTQDEDWRFTNVSPIAKLPVAPLLDPTDHGLKAADLAQFNFVQMDATRLVFVDGFFAPSLSSAGPQKNGAWIGSLASALAQEHWALEKHLARYAQTERNAFTALNTAFFTDGAFIYLPEGTTARTPVHLLFVSTGSRPGASSFPRNLILAEKGSQLTLIESYVGLRRSVYFTNAVSEFVLGDNAVVEHCKFQEECL